MEPLVGDIVGSHLSDMMQYGVAWASLLDVSILYMRCAAQHDVRPLSFEHFASYVYVCVCVPALLDNDKH